MLLLPQLSGLLDMTSPVLNPVITSHAQQLALLLLLLPPTLLLLLRCCCTCRSP
jgi:hypothetical protein